MAHPEKSNSPETNPPTDSGLARLREQIDEVDRDILARLNERAKLVQQVGERKRSSGVSVYEPSRERRIVDVLAEMNGGPFPDAGLAPVFREIISATRSLEDPVHVAYLGPEGTFSHQAALKKFGALAQLRDMQTITDVFSAVESDRVALGIVPVENTTEGVITRTLDALAEFDVTICAEAVLRISHDLLSQSGNLEQVRRVASHPQPLAQCRRWLDANLSGVERVETASTAIAAKLAAEDASVAAIGSRVAGEVYGLRSVETSIEDRRDNSTRFFVIGKTPAPPSGNDRTLAFFTIRKDEAGGLHRLIEPLASRGVNLTSIQLRPINGKPWEYLFFLDLEGHRTDPTVADALSAAAAVANSSRVLGSFPHAESERGSGGR